MTLESEAVVCSPG